MAATSQVAYDLSRFDNRARVREAVASEAVSAPAPKVRVETQAKKVAPHISMWAVLGFLTAMALMFFIVFSYMQLTEISTASGALNREIKQLQKESVLLTSQKESMIDMREIERIAKEELGMVKPSKDQIIYIDLSGEDHAVVADKTVQETGDDSSD